MREPSATEIAEFRRQAIALLRESENDLEAIAFGDDAQPLAVALLYCTILQSISECFFLLSQQTITVPGIMRGIFESFADLRAVVRHPKYAGRMLATFYAEKVRHLENMIEFPTNAYHADVMKQLDPTMELPRVRAMLKELEDRDQKPLSNKGRFVAAELVEEYQSMYWQLCLDSHNNLSALEDRHYEKRPDGSLGLVLSKENSTHDLARYYDGLVGVLLDSAIHVHKLMNTSKASKYEGLLASLQKFRNGLGSNS